MTAVPTNNDTTLREQLKPYRRLTKQVGGWPHNTKIESVTHELRIDEDELVAIIRAERRKAERELLLKLGNSTSENGLVYQARIGQELSRLDIEAEQAAEGESNERLV